MAPYVVLPSLGVSEDIYACPFCRELFARGEVRLCPQCDLEVQPLAELPPSHEAQLMEPEDPTPPQDEVLPMSDLGRGRGPLLLLSVLGVAVFFAPWVHETAPEIQTLSGFEFAQALPWLWAAGVAWMVMIPLVLSRRTIRQMRGARVAVGFLASMVLVTVVARVSIPVPSPHPLLPVRVEWGWGLYVAGFLAVLALFYAWRFGGALEDMPSQKARPAEETLH